MSRTRQRPGFLVRLDRALRELVGAEGTMSDPKFAAALAAGGPAMMSRLRHPAMEARYKNRPLRAGGRELAASDPYARQFLRLLDLMVAGPDGISRRADLRDAAGEIDKETNATIDAAWLDWAGSAVTTDRRLSLTAVCHVVQRTETTDGEYFVRMVDGYPNRHRFALQIYDADQCDSQLNQERYGRDLEVRNGVLIDQWGGPVGYVMRDFPPGAGFGYGARLREPYVVSAYDPRTGEGEMLHGFLSLRPNQTRGMSWFAPVLDAAETRLAYSNAELIAAQRAAASPQVLQAREGNAAELMEDPPGIDDPAALEAWHRRQREPQLDVDPNVVTALPPGWELGSVSPEHPTTAFPSFMKAILREYASALGPTYETLCNDRESTNYGSLRGGMILERDFFAQLQGRMVSDLLQPIGNRWLRMSMLAGAATRGREGLQLPGADWRQYAAAIYDAREFDWIDPLKDIQASAVAIQIGLATRTEIASKMGKRWADMAQQLADEKETADLLGISIDPPGTAQADAQKTIADEEAAAAATTNGNGKGSKSHASTAPNQEQRLAALLSRLRR